MNLNGEVELFVEDERHLLTESCLVYIPAGDEPLPHERPAGRPAHLPLLGGERDQGLRARGWERQ